MQTGLIPGTSLSQEHPFLMEHARDTIIKPFLKQNILLSLPILFPHFLSSDLTSSVSANLSSFSDEKHAK